MSGEKRCPLRRLVGDRAFTLIELLVVMGVIALVVSLMLPAMSKAKGVARQVKEMAAGQQLNVAMAAYANDHKGMVLVGYPTRAMVDGGMVVVDESGERVMGAEAQRYPLRIAPYLSHNFGGLYTDARFMERLRAGAERYAAQGITYNYVLSLFPALGMNASFVGGSDRVGGFSATFQRVFGRVHLERLDEANRPSEVIAFASARAGEQNFLPSEGKNLQGFFVVESPVFVQSEGARWEGSYDEGAANTGANSGFVSLRHAGRAVTAHLDGHATVLGWGELRDMRRWWDGAGTATSGIVPRF